MNVVVANGNLEASYIIEMFKGHGNTLTVINSSRHVATSLNKKHHVTVIIGDPWKYSLLEEANIHDYDVFISLCDKDTDNYACCVLAKKVFNVKKCICTVKNPANVELYKKLGIDSVISSTYLLAQNVKNETNADSLVRSLSLDNDKIVLIEATVLSKFRIANMPIKSLGFPKYASIAYIVRNYSFVIPSGDVVIRPRDQLFVACSKDDEKKLLAFLQKEKSDSDWEKQVASEETPMPTPIVETAKTPLKTQTEIAKPASKPVSKPTTKSPTKPGSKSTKKSPSKKKTTTKKSSGKGKEKK